MVMLGLLGAVLLFIAWVDDQVRPHCVAGAGAASAGVAREVDASG